MIELKPGSGGIGKRYRSERLVHTTSCPIMQGDYTSYKYCGFALGLSLQHIDALLVKSLPPRPNKGETMKEIIEAFVVTAGVLVLAMLTWTYVLWLTVGPEGVGP